MASKALRAVERDPINFKNQKWPLKFDEDFVRNGLSKDGLLLRFVSPKEHISTREITYTRDDKLHRKTIEYRDLKADKEIVRIAVTQNGLALEFADKSLKADREICKIAVTQNNMALNFVAKSIHSEISQFISAKEK